MNLGRRCVLVGALAAAGATTLASAAAATDDPAQYKAGLVTLCSTDSVVRVGALNEAPVDV
ncbi:MAG: hypothetical protein MUE78_08495, partial [Ilumatobacteraceae bacterium]|nr:hypothetical protein [Ilumatobacteraceae bacterium]